MSIHNQNGLVNKFLQFRIWAYRLLPQSIRTYLVWLLSSKHGLGVVGIILNQEKQVLLVHQTYDEPIRLPGGLMNYGEHPYSTLQREILEEVNCKVQPKSILGIEKLSKRKLDIYVLA